MGTTITREGASDGQPGDLHDDDEDQVVALVRDHIRTDHPELLDMATPEMIRTWIEIIP